MVNNKVFQWLLEVNSVIMRSPNNIRIQLQRHIPLNITFTYLICHVRQISYSPIGYSTTSQSSTMNKFDLSYELTYKFLRAREVEELHKTKIISGDHVQPGVRNTGAVHICFLCVTRPDAQNLVTQNTVQEKQFTTVSRINIATFI